MIVFIRLNIALILHVDHLFLYPGRDGPHDDRDIYGFSSRSEPITMRRSPDQLWTQRPDQPRDSHRGSSFERFQRPRSPWQSRPRLPVRPESPVHRKPQSLLSMGTISYSFDGDKRGRYADKRQLLDSLYYDARSWQSTVAEMHLSKATADFALKHTLPRHLADSKYQQPHYLPEKRKTYQRRDRVLHDSESTAVNAKQRASFSKLPHDKQRRGIQHSRGGVKQEKTTSTQMDHRPLSRVKKSGSTLADHLPTKISSVPRTAAETGQAAKASDQTPMKTSTSDESTAAIRPEDIIIIRRYNLDDSTAEKKLEAGGQTAKRHVIRLVRNNITSPLATSESSVADYTESGADAGHQNMLKKRRWSGVTKNMQPSENSEGNAASSRVDDETQPNLRRRYIDTFICICWLCSSNCDCVVIGNHILQS